MDQAKEAIQIEMEKETYERLRKIKMNALEPVQGAGSSSSTGSSDLRRKYASMTAAEIVLEVFSNAEGVFSPRMAKVSDGCMLLTRLMPPHIQHIKDC